MNRAGVDGVQWLCRRDEGTAGNGRKPGWRSRATPWAELARENRKANCLDHGGVARIGLCGGLRFGAHSDSERAQCLQHGRRAALLRRET